MLKFKHVAVCALVVALPAVSAGTATATATAKHIESASKLFTLKSGKTRTFSVGYPYALKYGNAKYSGTVRISPQSGKVKVLSKGPAVGGTVFRVKVRNRNASSVRAVKVRITATTTWYS